ncbi:MAG TPA: DsrE family protein [Aequorivita sp.]|nr:DsrE family protein [Aequorivita sp.]
MKNSILYILMFLSLGLMAQDKNTHTDFVILTSQFDQLEPILITAESLSSKDNFQIVLYGKDVKQITEPEMEKYLIWAEKSEAKFFVCQMSLNRLKIEKSELPSGIEIVDNAFLYSLQLQKKGYKTLNL